MVELKRLEEKPLCHRIAAQMLMKNCAGLEGINEQDYEFYSGRVQRHQVESFAASLALCDMERGNMDIPDACSPFQLPALLRALEDGQGHLQVSAEQVGACLTGLAQDHSHCEYLSHSFAFLSPVDVYELFRCYSKTLFLGRLLMEIFLGSSWLSYRDKALMFCRAARMDIEKGMIETSMLTRLDLT
jgi:hypothetical protein